MKSVNWTQYAQVYDLMTEVNPAYQELLGEFETFLGKSGLQAGQVLADLGAGTGNFSTLAARSISGLEVIHIDGDPMMNALAKTKDGGGKMRIQEGDLAELNIGKAAYDAVVSVHALYTLSQPKEFLAKIAKGLKPGGKAFLCDLGRVLDIADWRRFLMRKLIEERGLLQAGAIAWRGRKVASENRRIASCQIDGRYWTHSHEEFREAVEQAGMNILESREAYRGYSDLVIAERRER
ncbi:class I SAM-dependent methyltransferase [Akkermansiaceae bacterium]|nr:class I SAM-dependent methyltransferase [Akkermansiaceae bacterium]